MCTLNQSTKNWLEENLIPELKLLHCKSDCEVKYNISIPENSFFLSTLFFLDLQFLDRQQKCENTIHVVVKRPSSERNISDYVNFENLFHNEILFYTKCSRVYGCCPKFMIEPRDESTIVVENLISKGYRLSSMKVNVSNQLVKAAVSELAKFHATGYVFKHKNPEEFFQIVNKVKTFDQVHTERMSSLFNCALPRVFHHLRMEKYDRVFCDKLEIFLHNPYAVLVELGKPVEPLATLCHGDFTINNILYKEENDQIFIKLIDFSMISYSSPFVDFAVFLLLSGSREQRREKFTEIFDVYCDTLWQILKENGILDFKIFSKEKLLEDYKRHVMVGYIVACFFRPWLMGCHESNPEHLKDLTLEEKCKLHGSIGGDEVTKILVEMLFDLKEFGCLDHIINI